MNNIRSFRFPVCGSLLSICTEFLSDRRQRVLTVLVDGAAAARFGAVRVWVDPNNSRHATWKCVGSSSIYSMSGCCLLVENLRTDNLPMQMTPHYWQLFAIADRPAVAASHEDLEIISRFWYFQLLLILIENIVRSISKKRKQFMLKIECGTFIWTFMFTINFDLPEAEMAKKWSLGFFMPNLPQLGYFIHILYVKVVLE